MCSGNNFPQKVLPTCVPGICFPNHVLYFRDLFQNKVIHRYLLRIFSLVADLFCHSILSSACALLLLNDSTDAVQQSQSQTASAITSGDDNDLSALRRKHVLATWLPGNAYGRRPYNNPQRCRRHPGTAFEMRPRQDKLDFWNGGGWQREWQKIGRLPGAQVEKTWIFGMDLGRRPQLENLDCTL